MLHQTLSKGWCRFGSGLLLGLIVRPRGRLVEAQPRFAAAENRSSCPAQRSGGPHPGHPRPVASLLQRARLLALRFFASAPLLPEPLFAEPAQPAHPSPGARVAPLAAGLRRGSYGAFGRLPRDGHDAPPGHRKGEGFSQGALLRAGILRAQRLQDRVGLRLQGGTGGGPRGHHYSLRVGPGGLRREAYRGGPRGLRALRSLPGRQRLHGARVGAALDGRVRGAGGGDAQERLPQGMVEGRSALGLRQAPDHRRGHRPAQGLLRFGAPPGQDVGRAVDALGRQGRGIHLRSTDQRLPQPTVAPPGGLAGLVRYTSLVLELPSIGWQLFVLGSTQSDSTASLSLLDTYATRLLTEPLRSSHGRSPYGRRTPLRP